MLKVQRLIKPNKFSGYKLEPGKTTKVRGFTIVNTNKFAVYVDKWTRKKDKRKNRKKRK